MEVFAVSYMRAAADKTTLMSCSLVDLRPSDLADGGLGDSHQTRLMLLCCNVVLLLCCSSLSCNIKGELLNIKVCLQVLGSTAA